MNWRTLLGMEGRRPPEAASQVVYQLTRPPIVIGPTPDIVVEAPPRQAWDEKRWEVERRQGHRVLSGSYRVRDRRTGTWREFPGQLVEYPGHEIATYIADPPPEVRLHPHGACLQLIQAPWFRLHWNRAPRTLDDALLYMERLLDEALNVYGRW